MTTGYQLEKKKYLQEEVKFHEIMASFLDDTLETSGW